MRKFLIRRTVPPGGFVYKIPETGDEVTHGDFAQLVTAVRTVYTRNKLTPPNNLPDLIEHFICLHSPPSFCFGTYEPGDAQSHSTSRTKVVEASEFKNVRLKWPRERYLAPLPLAEQRAATCVKCAEHSPGFCTVCNGLAGFAEKIVGERTTGYDKQLGLCSICDCIVKVKIHISVEALRLTPEKTSQAPYPDNCWLVTEGVYQ